MKNETRYETHSRCIDADEAQATIFYPKLRGTRCECTTDETKMLGCRKCFGSGIIGGFDKGPEIMIVDVEIKHTASSNFISMSTLDFMCPITEHVYCGCFLELEGSLWRILGVEEDEWNLKTMELPTQWKVQARGLEEFEPQRAFFEWGQYQVLCEECGHAIFDSREPPPGMKACPKCGKTWED